MLGPHSARQTALALAVAFSGILLAQAPDTIHACAKANQGQLRLIAAGESCLPSEVAVQWPASVPPAQSGPKIVDANGQFVAWLSGAPFTGIARLGSDWIFFNANASGVFGIAPANFFFATPCPASGLHTGGGAHVLSSASLLAKPTYSLDTPNVLLYGGTDDPTFVPASEEVTQAFPVMQRICISTTGQPGAHYQVVVSADFSSLALPLRLTDQ